MTSRSKSVCVEKIDYLTDKEIQIIINSKLRNFKFTFSAIQLLKKVRILEDTGCWILHSDWSVYYTYNKIRAHRLSYELFVGDIVNKNYICHHCDRKGCINYKHLFQGTASDNMNDWKNKKEKYLSNRQQEFLINRVKGKIQDPNKIIRSWREIASDYK